MIARWVHTHNIDVSLALAGLAGLALILFSNNAASVICGVIGCWAAAMGLIIRRFHHRHQTTGIIVNGHVWIGDAMYPVQRCDGTDCSPGPHWWSLDESGKWRSWCPGRDFASEEAER